MEIAREEVFGPVAVVIGYDDSAGDPGGDPVSGAVAIANDSRYGLVGAVWSADDDRAAAVASRLQAGSVRDQFDCGTGLRQPVRRFQDVGHRPRRRP